MLGLAAVSLLVAAALAATPVFQGNHYTAYKLQDADFSTRPPGALEEYTEVVNGEVRTTIETPVEHHPIPEDTGGNFGDRQFITLPTNGTLISRDTIVNHQYDEEDLYIYYNRTFSGYYIENMRVINIGRERAWVESMSITHARGFVETRIYVAAGYTA